ncbi:hypothetical protein TPHA_0J02220 [Tetrapisispora phaffii CBS 4417]|uniref:AMP-activated protein kinase glycogen-binding domain-containing protein n=1 Tax=Tetrapisispora phaffii (strain ATCC 24235 / CBS 4417 / NBRC 1672 / NRRL Y-8282 / UCD 70-5) TaxID=1071381 RepID=G8BYV0_TETPH|nr:hypothetical protein TPHA_0J02220 [Tetrapisispora phaffii CBS 4417]CCE65042.1 hypothetical protein TPHA_0J02220 [Tetrapisispora phaffii CBS 4417]
MTIITYKQPLNKFRQLNIAGEFNDWKIVSMSLVGEEWVYKIDFPELGDEPKKFHFKFIDDNDNWFVGDNYPKELDKNSNENNVVIVDPTEDSKLSTPHVKGNHIKESRAGTTSYISEDETTLADQTARETPRQQTNEPDSLHIKTFNADSKAVVSDNLSEKPYDTESNDREYAEQEKLAEDIQNKGFIDGKEPNKYQDKNTYNRGIIGVFALIVVFVVSFF